MQLTKKDPDFQYFLCFINVACFHVFACKMYALHVSTSVLVKLYHHYGNTVSTVRFLCYIPHYFTTCFLIRASYSSTMTSLPLSLLSLLTAVLTAEAVVIDLNSDNFDQVKLSAIIVLLSSLPDPSRTVASETSTVLVKQHCHICTIMYPCST